MPYDAQAYNVARDINDQGQIVGDSGDAVLWDGTGVHPLGTLGGAESRALDNCRLIGGEGAACSTGRSRSKRDEVGRKSPKPA